MLILQQSPEASTGQRCCSASCISSKQTKLDSISWPRRKEQINTQMESNSQQQSEGRQAARNRSGADHLISLAEDFLLTNDGGKGTTVSPPGAGVRGTSTMCPGVGGSKVMRIEGKTAGTAGEEGNIRIWNDRRETRQGGGEVNKTKDLKKWFDGSHSSDASRSIQQLACT